MNMMIDYKVYQRIINFTTWRSYSYNPADNNLYRITKIAKLCIINSPERSSSAIPIRSPKPDIHTGTEYPGSIVLLWTGPAIGCACGVCFGGVLCPCE
jgi:hypothetical protein